MRTWISRAVTENPHKLLYSSRVVKTAQWLGVDIAKMDQYLFDSIATHSRSPGVCARRQAVDPLEELSTTSQCKHSKTDQAGRC